MDLERRSIPLGARPALVLVDMQTGFTDPACALGAPSDPVVAANIALLEKFRRQSLPVFFTRVIYSGQEASVFRARVPALDLLKPGADWVEIDPRLERRPDEPVIDKHWASGFFDTDLADQLRQAGADCLVVTGLTTSGCVRATAVDGLQHNFPVFVVREAVGDRNAEAHAANLFDLHAKYADVVSLDAFGALFKERFAHAD